MKNQLILICSLATLFIQCKSKKNSENVKVALEMTISSDYCGGAPPTEEILKDITSSKPFVNHKFYLVLKNEAGIVLSETEHKTDENSKLTLKIKKGMYDIYLNSEVERKKMVENIDEKYRSCSTVFYAQPQGHLHAWKKGLQKIDLHIKCNPCMPPAP